MFGVSVIKQGIVPCKLLIAASEIAVFVGCNITDATPFFCQAHTVVHRVVNIIAIGAFMFTNTWRHSHTCAVHWLAKEPQPPAFTCKTCAMSEPKRWSIGLNIHIFVILMWGKTYVDSFDKLSYLCYVKKSCRMNLVGSLFVQSWVMLNLTGLNYLTPFHIF